MTTRHALPAALLVLASVPAAAFVMSGRNVLRRFAVVEATTRIAESPLTGSARLASGPVDLGFSLELSPGGCRATVQTPRGESRATLAAGELHAEGASLPALEAFVALACPLISIKRVSAEDAELDAMRFAAQLGVNVELSSLSRTDNRVGYVLGAPPRDARRPQLWFDQQTGRPLRVIAAHGGRLWDVHLLDGGSIATNRQAPRVAEVWADGERQLELRMMAVTPRLPSRDMESEFREEGDD